MLKYVKTDKDWEIKRKIVTNVPAPIIDTAFIQKLLFWQWGVACIQEVGIQKIFFTQVYNPYTQKKLESNLILVSFFEDRKNLIIAGLFTI